MNDKSNFGLGLALGLGLAVALGSTGCGGPAASPAEMSLYLTRAADDAGGGRVVVERMEARGAGGDWRTLATPNTEVDLASLAAGARKALASVEVESGRLEELKLRYRGGDGHEVEVEIEVEIELEHGIETEVEFELHHHGEVEVHHHHADAQDDHSGHGGSDDGGENEDHSGHGGGDD